MAVSPGASRRSAFSVRRASGYHHRSRIAIIPPGDNSGQRVHLLRAAGRTFHVLAYRRHGCLDGPAD